MKLLQSLAVTSCAIATLALATLSPAEARNGPQVTGGGNVIAGGVVFNMSANATDTRNGPKGNIQYSRNEQDMTEALKVHAAVECFGVAEDGSQAALAGPARAQVDPAGIIGPDTYLLVHVHEGGTGSGDTVRVQPVDMIAAMDACDNPTGNAVFPGFVQGGNFQLTP